MKDTPNPPSIMSEPQKELVQTISQELEQKIPYITIREDNYRALTRNAPRIVEELLWEMSGEVFLNEIPHIRSFDPTDWAKFYHPQVFHPIDWERLTIFPWASKTLNSRCFFEPQKWFRDAWFPLVALNKLSLGVLDFYLDEAQRIDNFVKCPWYGRASIVDGRAVPDEPFAWDETLFLTWYMVRIDIIPGSDFMPFKDQEKLVSAHRGCEVPLAILEVLKNRLLYRKYGQDANRCRWANTASRTRKGKIVRVGNCSAGAMDIESGWGHTFGTGLGIGAVFHPELDALPINLISKRI